MNSSNHLPLFLTTPDACSYLPETSQSLCVDPNRHIDTHVFTILTEQGFRRSGQFVYRPHCPACSACIPVRIRVKDFNPNQQEKRILKRGQRLHVIEQTPRFTDEYYALYQEYITERHADGDMFPVSVNQFDSFLAQPIEFARFFEFRLDGKLMALAVTDVLEDSLSAVYCFFDPKDKYFSLGRNAILWQIQHAQYLGLDYLYLGYWIKECRKMNYKSQYQPMEYLVDGQWQQQP